jgi:hypothetical protein
MLEVTPQQVRAKRLRAQRLHPQAAREDAVEVVRAVCGVNAQHKPAMMLSLRARARGFGPDDLADLTDVRRLLVKTWAMRGTIHLLSRDDPGWMLPLISPSVIAKARGRRRELGLDEKKLARGLEEIKAILGSSGPLTRDELVELLNERDLGIERKSQAPYHLIADAGLNGLVVMGPDRPDGEPTYVMAERPAEKPKPREEALAVLTERYLRGYGPASPADFAAWSGLPAADAKKGWALLKERRLLTEVEVDGRALGTVDSEPAPPGNVVNLLPAFDTLVLGYADRELVVPGRHYKDVYHGGQTVPVVLANGAAAGVWRYEARGRKLRIEVRPFEAFGREIKELIETEAEDIGRLFGKTPTLVYGGR